MYGYKTPIYDAIKKYTDISPVPFHMPGHKLGKGIPKEFLRDIECLDLTEIPGLDSLHFPNGAIKEAMSLASHSFSADETFFLVNGSTAGNIAMILTICNDGDKLIVSRDCHRSIINAMILGGIKPVYVCPQYNEEFRITSSINMNDLEETIKVNLDAKGIIITRPNYYGICSDITLISSLAHKYNMILAVDEAHGTHLKFNKRLPISSMDGGADICVQSAHKTLPALTQSAYLHVKGNRIDLDKLKFNLQMVQTTSPSYILMAYLDIARAAMDKNGERLLNKTIDYSNELIHNLNKKYLILTKQNLENCDMDVTRIVVNVGNLVTTGYEVEKILKEKFNIQVEMADFTNIVCIGCVSDTHEDYKKLESALNLLWSDQKEISKNKLNKFILNSNSSDNYINRRIIPHQELSFKEVYKSKSKKVKLDESNNMISKGIVTPYPPGIPLICPGEKIDKEMIEYINMIIECSGIVNGIGENREIEVVD